MSSLPDSLRRLGDEVAAFYASGHPAETPPYIAYVYRPRDEFRVRRDLADLQVWLSARGIACVPISLADLFTQAIAESGYLERIFAEEEARPDDADTLAFIHTSINQVLSGPPSLADRVIAALQDAPPRATVFLYRAGALYPTYRTSALLDELRERLPVPVVLLYPGRLVGAYGLSFMGRCEPVHGYRAKIILREDR